MKILKIIASAIGYLIYHETKNYTTRTIIVSDLHYEMYHLYRIDKFLMFIHIHRLVEKSNNLGKGKEIKNLWYYNYPNLKEI